MSHLYTKALATRFVTLIYDSRWRLSDTASCRWLRFATFLSRTSRRLRRHSTCHMNPLSAYCTIPPTSQCNHLKGHFYYGHCQIPLRFVPLTINKIAPAVPVSHCPHLLRFQTPPLSQKWYRRSNHFIYSFIYLFVYLLSDYTCRLQSPCSYAVRPNIPSPRHIQGPFLRVVLPPELQRGWRRLS